MKQKVEYMYAIFSLTPYYIKEKIKWLEKIDLMKDYYENRFYDFIDRN